MSEKIYHATMTENEIQDKIFHLKKNVDNALIELRNLSEKYGKGQRFITAWENLKELIGTDKESEALFLYNIIQNARTQIWLLSKFKFEQIIKNEVEI